MIEIHVFVVHMRTVNIHASVVTFILQAVIYRQASIVGSSEGLLVPYNATCSKRKHHLKSFRNWLTVLMLRYALKELTTSQ